MKKMAIGIDLGGTTIKFAWITESGEVTEQWVEPTPVHDQGSQIVPTILASLQNKMKAHGLTSRDFFGIGMGSPGAVDHQAGTVTGAYNLNWTDTVDIKQQIESALKLPFVLDNDANVAALGEQWKGAGNNAADVVFVTLGTGVGGGVISRGKLVRGVSGAAGEIGHIKVEPNGFPCTCGGTGCLETVASATGIVNLAKAEAESFAGTSGLAQLIMKEEAVSAKMIFDRARQKDPFAELVLQKVGGYLGTACANIANILNPSAIVLGGGVSKAGELLLHYVRPYFEQHAFPSVKETTSLRIATLENTAGVLGAGLLVFKQVETDETVKQHVQIQQRTGA